MSTFMARAKTSPRDLRSVVMAFSRARTKAITYTRVWGGSLILGLICMIPFARAHSSGIPTTAKVEDCRLVDSDGAGPGDSDPVCTGSWEVDGQQRSGEVTGLGVSDHEGSTVRARVVGDTAYVETTRASLLVGFALVGGGVGIVLHVGVWFTFRKHEKES
ncbi:hypothetical protein ACTWPT_25055 [Nonomuraea sp. 3N208]|uniref:hypothetical protein n=1 Tax=Nonomuraea sp. 3N208 TaxID=3457421 RepID=UPI003FD1CDB7